MRSLLAAALLIVCSLCGALAASDAPDWVKRGKPSDSTYKYYVGRSSRAASEQSGINEATREAYEQAIRENFGFQTRIQSDAYESSTDVISTKRVQVLSQDTRVFGFEQMDFYKENSAEKFDVWVLYRYPLAEIAREKSRLATTRGKAEGEYSEQGSAQAGQKSGVLEITSKPEGASVFVDGQSYGVTPMRLRGVLEPGQHRVRLDHPSFAAVEETAILVPGKTAKIDKTLIPALAQMSITTEPSNANIVINGQQLGTSPIALLEVPANKPLKLEITHAEANPFSVNLEVAKDETNVKHFDLPLKNASLLVRSSPAGAEVYIDGQMAGYTPAGPKTLQAGRHEVRLRKPGFQEERLDLQLRGGEKKVVDGLKLQTSKAGSEPALWTQMSTPRERTKARSADESTAVVFSLWVPQIRTSSADYPSIGLASWGGSLTLLFAPWWGMEIGYTYGSRSIQFSDSTSTLAAHRVHLGFPFVLYRAPNQHFYISADVDYLIGHYTLQFTSDSLLRVAPNQVQWGYGASVGYRLWGIESGLGVGVRMGIMNHTNSAMLTGVVSYGGGFECLVAL